MYSLRNAIMNAIDWEKCDHSNNLKGTFEERPFWFYQGKLSH